MGRIILTLLLLQALLTTQAQQFQVAGFRQLPNDISAFITPVRDLNDEACALLKVVCSSDFAFSSPLGIVSRKNEVGEVWLYLPKGSTALTLKHPQWGVLRDYQFKMPLESRMTYELVVRSPLEKQIKPLVFNLPQENLHGKSDTLVVLTGKQRRPSTPIRFMATVTLTLTNDHPMAGLRIAAVKRHGLYLAANSDFHTCPATDGETDNQGSAPPDEPRTYDTGRTRTARMSLTAGLVHQIGRRLTVYEGGGWGRHTTAWEQMDGRWFKNTDQSHQGWCAEAGAGYSMTGWLLTAGVQTLKGREWGVCIGFGVKL